MATSIKHPNVPVCDAALNPFLCKIKLSKTQKIKVVILGVLLAPIRFVLVSLLTALMAGIGRLSAQRLPNGEHKPFDWFSMLGQNITRYLARVTLFVAGFHHIKFKGKIAPAEEAPIIVMAPHSSFLDSYALCMLENISIIIKQEIEDTYLINGISYSMKPIIVKRGEKGSLTKITTTIHKRIKEGGWPPLLIFPEGTCTNRQALISFKVGAFQPGLPVQPVTMSFPNKTDAASWTWKGPPTWRLLWYLLAQFHNYLEMEALPVYHPSEEISPRPCDGSYI